jgi:hypothetical protein
VNAAQWPVGLEVITAGGAHGVVAAAPAGCRIAPGEHVCWQYGPAGDPIIHVEWPAPAGGTAVGWIRSSHLTRLDAPRRQVTYTHKSSSRKGR